MGAVLSLATVVQAAGQTLLLPRPGLALALVGLSCSTVLEFLTSQPRARDPWAADSAGRGLSGTGAQSRRRVSSERHLNSQPLPSPASPPQVVRP